MNDLLFKRYLRCVSYRWVVRLAGRDIRTIVVNCRKTGAAQQVLGDYRGLLASPRRSCRVPCHRIAEILLKRRLNAIEADGALRDRGYIVVVWTGSDSIERI